MNPVSDKNILQELRRVVIDLLISEPFYGHLLARMEKAVDIGSKNMEIRFEESGSFLLLVQPDYWNNSLRSDHPGTTLRLRSDKLKSLVRDSLFSPGRTHLQWMASTPKKTILSYYLFNLINEVYQGRLSGKREKVPEEALSYLQTVSRPGIASVNWKRTLRFFLSTGRQSKIVNTIHRPSKRFGDRPGIRIRRNCRLLIAIDTSASVEVETLMLFFEQIEHLRKICSDIHIIECDTHLRRSYPYQGVQPARVSGRGGTDYNEAIRFSNKQYINDLLIYFTDGKGPIPYEKPRKPVLWALSPEGIPAGSEKWKRLPGRKIKITKSSF